MTRHILVVDDDTLMRRSLAFNLEQAGYKASTAANAEEALSLARQQPLDLILLDIGLPGMDGLDAVKIFKNEINLPVIFLTARRRELDEVLGLELGADDYVTKPFDVDVLLARIKAVLRRTDRLEVGKPDQSPLVVGSISLDPQSHNVLCAGQTVGLSPREFDLLHCLMAEAGKVLSVDELIQRVWGAEFIGQPQVVYVHIRWLRQKLEANPNQPQLILTIRGVGYKFVKA